MTRGFELVDNLPANLRAVTLFSSTSFTFTWAQVRGSHAAYNHSCFLMEKKAPTPRGWELGSLRIENVKHFNKKLYGTDSNKKCKRSYNFITVVSNIYFWIENISVCRLRGAHIICSFYRYRYGMYYVFNTGNK